MDDNIGRSGIMSPLYSVPDGITRALAVLVLACFSVLANGHELPPARPAAPALQVGVFRFPPLMVPEGDGYLDLTLKELFIRAGVEYKLITTPLRRGMSDTNSGVLDAALVPFPDVEPQYTNLVALAEPLLPTYLAGLYTRDDMSLSTVEDFFDYRVAHLRGWNLAEDLLTGHHSVQEVRNSRLMMKMLAGDRVDVVLFSPVLGQYIADEIGLQNMKVSDFQINRNLYLQVHKRHTGLLEPLNEALVAMKEEGTMDSILTDYDSGR